MSRRASLLITLPAVLGLLHPVALAEPPRGVRPNPEPGPTAAVVALEATLDELAKRLEQLGEAGTNVGTEALRQELTAARGRISELEAARAIDAAIIAELRAELEGSEAEARALREQLGAAREGLGQLNAVLAAAAGRVAAAGGNGAAAREAGAGSSSAPPASPPAGDPDASDGEPAYYVATSPVNLRAAPRNSAEILTAVGEGELVRRIGRDGGWLRVHHTNRFATDFTGWAHSNFLRSAAPHADG